MQNELLIRNGAVKLVQLGPRAVAEFFCEYAAKTGSGEKLAEMLQLYSSLSPELVRAVGGDRFPPLALHVVPDLAEAEVA